MKALIDKINVLINIIHQTKYLPKEDKHDIRQEVLCYIIKTNPKNMDDIEVLTPLLWEIIKNMGANVYRKKKKKHVEYMEWNNPDYNKQYDESEFNESDSKLDLIKNHIQYLDVDDQLILKDHLNGLKATEIAKKYYLIDQLDANNRIRLIYQRLKKVIKKRNPDLIQRKPRKKKEWKDRKATKDNKLKIANGIPIKQYYLYDMDNKTYKVYLTLAEIGREIGYHREYLRVCCKENKLIKKKYKIFYSFDVLLQTS